MNIFSLKKSLKKSIIKNTVNIKIKIIEMKKTGEKKSILLTHKIHEFQEN